jgi:hypothetical protein
MHAWKNQVIVDNFLTNTRKAIPLGEEQLDLLLRLISKSQPIVNNFIDAIYQTAIGKTILKISRNWS